MMSPATCSRPLLCSACLALVCHHRISVHDGLGASFKPDAIVLKTAVTSCNMHVEVCERSPPARIRIQLSFPLHCCRGNALRLPHILRVDRTAPSARHSRTSPAFRTFHDAPRSRVASPRLSQEEESAAHLGNTTVPHILDSV